MAGLIFEEKLESLRRCVQRIEQKRASSAEALRGDPDRQDILTVNLTRAIQLCVDLAIHALAAADEAPPATMGEAFEKLAEQKLIAPDLARRMKAAVGFRNIAVHSYREIDWGIVHEICWQHLDDFRRFARAVSNLKHA